jgi:hypothetical protein
VPAVSVLSANAADPDRPGRRCRVCVTVLIRIAWSRGLRMGLGHPSFTGCAWRRAVPLWSEKTRVVGAAPQR